MEVKIGVAEAARELVLNSTMSPDEVEALVSDALKNPQGTLALVDEKGRRFVVPTPRIAYVEIGTADSRKVGFTVGE